MKVLDATGRWTRVSLAGDDLSGFLDGGTAHTLGEVELIGTSDGGRRHRSYAEVYRANPWLWACVNLIARSMSRFPLKVYRGLDNGTTERVRPGASNRAETFAAALRRPGRGRSQKTLVHSTAVDRLVNGNAIWFPERTRTGAYTGFQRIPWKYTVIEQVAGLDRYWDSREPSRKRLADDVIHFGAALDCDDLINPSPIVSLRATLALYDAVERHLVAYFKNSARPSGLVEIEKSTPPGTRKLIAEELRKLYSGPENAGKIIATSGKWHSITETPEHNKVIELAKQSREEIAGAYGVPPPMVGILDRAIMSNVRELRSHLARDVVGTHTGLFEGDIDAQVIARDPALGDIEVEFEMAAYLRPDLEARAKTWKDQRYLLTLNEMREIENRPPIDHPDADVPWMPLNEAPLGADDTPDDSDANTDDDDPGEAGLFDPSPKE